MMRRGQKWSPLALSLLLLLLIAGCNTPQPVKPEDISEPTMARNVSHAEAWNVIIPWRTQEDKVPGAFVEGPFKGFKIESDERGALTGYRIYVHRRGGCFRPQDIEAHYQRKLVEEWYRGDKWQRLEDCSSSYYCWAWKRGRQVFVVVSPKVNCVEIFHTYLMSK